VIKAGRLSSVISGVESACKTVMPMMEAIAPAGVSYVGEAELARICKIAHNVMLGVVIENLIEITASGQQDGRAAPRLPRLHEQQRHGLDVHALQVASAG